MPHIKECIKKEYINELNKIIKFESKNDPIRKQ